MSQGTLCPNLSQKVQKEVSQMANRYAIRWFKCKLKPPKKWCMNTVILGRNLKDMCSFTCLAVEGKTSISQCRDSQLDFRKFH